MSSHEATPRFRWHRHPINNDLIFTVTYHGVSRLPKSVSYGIGRVATWLACKCFKESTAALFENLRIMFPEKGVKETRRLVLETYRSYARDTIDFIRSLSMPPERLAPLIVVEDGHIANLLGEGRGVLLVTGHMGNWELGGVALRRVFGHPLAIVAMDEIDPGVTRWRQTVRRSLGIDTVPLKHGPTTALEVRRLLWENRIVGMLFDRHLGQDRVEVRFFGRPTPFPITPALMAYFTGAPLLPCFFLRRPDGRYHARTGPLVHVDREGPAKEVAARATQTLASILEERVRESPHLWYQFYSFWDERAGEPT